MLALARWHRPAIVLFLALVAPVAAHAQTGTPSAICEDEKALPPDRRAACTAVIDGAADKPSDRADAYFHRGEAASDANEHDQAIADLSEAIKLKPDNSAAFILRGNSYDAKGDLDRALSDYNEAIRLDPGDATGYFNRAEVHFAKGEKDKAVADYTKALEIDPNFQGARDGLAEAQK